jgi:hypothetical protein
MGIRIRMDLARRLYLINFSLLKFRILILEYNMRIMNTAQQMFDMSSNECGIFKTRLKLDSVCQHHMLSTTALTTVHGIIQRRGSANIKILINQF